jgi:hemerythrin superfamily protein
MASSAQGNPDVVDILTADHREMTSLLASIASEGSAERRRDLADTVIAELVRHSVAEEMHVYPAMRKHLPEGDKAVEHDTEEHKELETLLKKLEKADAGSDEFQQVVRKLQEVLADHVKDEEQEQFPQLREYIPADDLVEMGGQVEKAKEIAPTRPHPHSPNTKAFHLVAGPGVGLVDRLRDRLSGRTTG